MSLFDRGFGEGASRLEPGASIEGQHFDGTQDIEISGVLKVYRPVSLVSGTPATTPGAVLQTPESFKTGTLVLVYRGVIMYPDNDFEETTNNTLTLLRTVNDITTLRTFYVLKTS